MQAQETQLFKLLSGQQHFMIPLFQRPYSWDKDNWEDLWKDVLETYEMGAQTRHFLGSVVTKSLPATPEGVSPFLVIDGQQRLTTLTILLAVLRDTAKTSSPQLADMVHRLYLTNEFASGLSKLKVLPTQADRDAYAAVIVDGQPDGATNRVQRAYQFFRARLDESDEGGASLDLLRLQQVLTNGFELVSITLSEADNEYRIFESLNATGTPLTQADLLRNYFFMRIPIAQQDAIYHQQWLPLQQALGEDLENFFRYEYMSDGQFVREGDVYQEWKKRLDKLKADEELIDCLKTLVHRGHLYKRLTSPQAEPHPGIANRLARLNRWGAQTLYPFLMYLYRHHDKGEISDPEFVDILQLLESFLVRRAFAGVPTNQLNRLFIRLSQQLPPGLGFVEGTWAALSEPGRRWPNDEVFRQSILRYPLYSEGRYEQRRLILESLEASYQHKEPVDLSGLTIEHVMPQALTPEWADALGEEAPAIHAKLKHVLGNLTLTGYNPELSNSPFEQKRELLNQSNLAMNKEIAAESQWTAHEIEERGKRLAERAIGLWPGPVS